jgi:hypothetical protein
VHEDCSDDEIFVPVESAASFFDGDTVMLSSRSYFLVDHVGEVAVEILRVGDGLRRIEVDVALKNAPPHIPKPQVSVCLEPGQFSVQFPIKYKKPATWTGGARFELHISIRSGEAILGCSACTIAIVNTTLFPSNSDKDQSLKATNGDEWALIKSFYKDRYFARSENTIRAGLAWLYISMHTSFLDNLCFYFIVSFLRPEQLRLFSGTHHGINFILVALIGYALSFAVESQCRSFQLSVRGDGITRRELRGWVLHKFLELDSAAHDDLNELEVLNSAMFRVEECVNECWSRVWNLIFETSGIIFAVLAMAVTFIYETYFLKASTTSLLSQLLTALFIMLPILFIPVAVWICVLQRGFKTKFLNKKRQACSRACPRSRTPPRSFSTDVVSVRLERARYGGQQ